MISGSEVNLSQVEQPAVIKRTGSFFIISTWVCLAVSTLWAISTTTDNNYFYFIPVTLYIAWMETFPHVSYIKEKGLIWQKLPPTPVRWKWDNKSPQRRNRLLLYLTVSFALVAWMNHYSPCFISMFFTLFGHTWGMLSWPLALPLFSCEAFVMFAQTGLFSSASRMSTEGLSPSLSV